MSDVFLSTVASLREIARPLDDATGIRRALDELLATRSEPPTMLALGEPTHGIAAFPLLRNHLLTYLVERGYRSIALEIDTFAATAVDEYVSGATTDLETALATGFSHGFGAVPGNRELVQWIRAHNDGIAPGDHIRFHGFDAPLEFAGAPSPRRSLAAVTEYLRAARLPATVTDLDHLLGNDAEWTDERAMFDPAASIGNSDRARTLRIVADDLASALRRAAPSLSPADPAGYALASAHARTAQSLLRYHAAMATPGDGRIANLLSLRTEMMADNLLDIVAREHDRGLVLVFAHNAHLQRMPSHVDIGDDEVSWGSAGARAALTLGDRYMFVATDANPQSDPDTLQGMLAAVTDRHALFAAPALLALLPESTPAGEPMLPGHIPVSAADLTGADALIFVADTDGKRHRYW